jgi:hypothetical protein
VALVLQIWEEKDNMFSKECKLHLKKAKMTRKEHFLFAIKTAGQLQLAVLALLIHSIAPRFFETYAGDTIKSIHAKITKR